MYKKVYLFFPKTCLNDLTLSFLETGFGGLNRAPKIMFRRTIPAVIRSAYFQPKALINLNKQNIIISHKTFDSEKNEQHQLVSWALRKIKKEAHWEYFLTKNYWVMIPIFFGYNFQEGADLIYPRLYQYPTPTVPY